MEIYVVLEYMLDEPADVVGCFSQKKDAERFCKELEYLSKGHSISYYVQSRLLNNLTTIDKIKEQWIDRLNGF